MSGLIVRFLDRAVAMGDTFILVNGTPDFGCWNARGGHLHPLVRAQPWSTRLSAHADPTTAHPRPVSA